jgi:hypothetical protein
MEKEEARGGRKDGRVIAKRQYADCYDDTHTPYSLAGIKDDEICTRFKFDILSTTNVSWQSGIQ